MNLTEFLKELDRNYIIGVVGDLGDGKTIAGVSLTILLAFIYNKYVTQKTILTNVPIGVDHEFLEYYNQLEERKDTLIFLDEIHQNADSRQSMKGQNFFTSGITMDVRKFNNKLIWSSQESGQVEKRVRNRTLLFLRPVRRHNLVFEIFLSDIRDRGYDSITLNLDAFKNMYDTHYKPLPLVMEEDVQ